ncbi:DUF3397 domain-containing protein [Saccharibacillus sp. CPCC 101409]|uniref:DUF3397 domain-containing protein n=1 Tax=Saccharibacillus sp. CPCC 101409 TaxID=3058041 RepID=UPI002671C390|nr:DUF3397 domain-containing protein [Saccharibacillus sp. CPCC 101409]MDO3409197.1 DUF3397 domain-containing protein [Saccharibacillus sp. CPCC 101409]
MFGTISAVLVTLCVLPFVPFVLIYAVGALRRQPKRLSFRRAMDGTTPFLIFSVSALFNYVFSVSFGFYLLLLLLLLLAGLLGSAQNRKRGRVDSLRLLRGVWRLAFLFLAPFYVILGIGGFILFLMNS